MTKKKKRDGRIDKAIETIVEYVDVLTPKEVEALRKVLDTRETA